MKLVSREYVNKLVAEDAALQGTPRPILDVLPIHKAVWFHFKYALTEMAQDYKFGGRKHLLGNLRRRLNPAYQVDVGSYYVTLPGFAIQVY